jgi:hypothetical protein
MLKFLEFLMIALLVLYFGVLTFFVLELSESFFKTETYAIIDCDIVHTIPNMPDSVLKQCERMKIK